MKLTRIEPVFVDTAPDVLQPGLLYVSVPYASTLHLCCCGCGTETVLPLRPNRWQLIFDGATVSLTPSVGNRFDCASHYWIDRDEVIWVDDTQRRHELWWRRWWNHLGRRRGSRTVR